MLWLTEDQCSRSSNDVRFRPEADTLRLSRRSRITLSGQVGNLAYRQTGAFYTGRTTK